MCRIHPCMYSCIHHDWLEPKPQQGCFAQPLEKELTGCSAPCAELHAHRDGSAVAAGLAGVVQQVRHVASQRGVHASIVGQPKHVRACRDLMHRAGSGNLSNTPHAAAADICETVSPLSMHYVKQTRWLSGCLPTYHRQTTTTAATQRRQHAHCLRLLHMQQVQTRGSAHQPPQASCTWTPPARPLCWAAPAARRTPAPCHL